MTRPGGLEQPPGNECTCGNWHSAHTAGSGAAMPWSSRLAHGLVLACGAYLQQMAVFRTPISCIAMYLVQVSASTSPWEWIQRVWCFPDSVLCLYYAAMPSVQLFDHLPFDHLDILRNITAGAFWMLSILKIMRGENLQFTLSVRGWMTRGVEPISLPCPQKFVISRYSWKPGHCH